MTYRRKRHDNPPSARGGTYPNEHPPTTPEGGDSNASVSSRFGTDPDVERRSATIRCANPLLGQRHVFQSHPAAKRLARWSRQPIWQPYDPMAFRTTTDGSITRKHSECAEPRIVGVFRSRDASFSPICVMTQRNASIMAHSMMCRDRAP